MNVICSSLFLGKQLDLLNFAALYAESVTLPFSNAGRVEPVDKVGPYRTGRVTEVYCTIPEGIQRRIQPFVEESVLIISENRPSSIEEWTVGGAAHSILRMPAGSSRPDAILARHQQRAA